MWISKFQWDRMLNRVEQLESKVRRLEGAVYPTAYEGRLQYGGDTEYGVSIYEAVNLLAEKADVKFCVKPAQRQSISACNKTTV